ncbi:MAG: hypothetical protein ABSA67_18755 [Candidatus Brocadiia bacterium]|jgi:hypothetical protein
MARVATAAALAWLLCAAAFAQPVPEPQYFSLNNFHGDVELRYDLDEDSLRDKTLGVTTTTTQQELDEIMMLSGDGFLYHPRFLTYRAAVGLDLTQGSSNIDSPTGNTRSSLNGVAPEYAISGSLLPQHAVSMDFSLNQATSTINPPFGEVTKVDDSNELATLSLNRGPLPTQFTVAHETSNQTQLGFGENRYLEDSWAQLTVNHTIPHSLSSFVYKYLDGHEDDEEVSSVSTKFHTDQKVQTATFNNTLSLGEGSWATLNSRATYQDETGTFPWTQFTEDESLLLKHTDNLTSQYSVDYSQVSVGAETTDLTVVQASLSHQLYESLISTARVYGSHQNSDQVTEDIEGCSLTENYRKRIPWGTLTVDTGAGYSVTDDNTKPGLNTVVNESQTLADTITTFLNNPNVVTSSVVVTNLSGGITYLLNVDYQLIPHGILTEIQRLPTGAIANATSVLVSYQYQSDLPITYGTTDLHGRVTLDLFDHLTLYVNRQSTENTVLSGTNMGQLQNLEETLFGTIIRWAPATVTAEHEIYDSSLTPYVSNMVSLDIAEPLGADQRIGGNATYRHVTFTGAGALTLRTAGLTYQLMPKDWPTINVTAGYEWSNDQGIANEYLYGRVAVEYHIRGTILSLEYQINNQNAPTSKELSQYAFFSIRRRLF